MATVYPGSGTYPIHTEFTISWPDGYDCWYQREEGLNPPDPPSPESQGGGGLLENSPKNWELTLPYTYKVKFQLYKDGNWGPVVFVQWVIEPELRIAQIDDEITGDDKYFGYWNLWEDNQWNPYPDTYFLRPEDSTDYFIRAQQNYKVNTNRKYNVWRKNSGESYWINHAQIPVDNSTSSVLAHFKNTYNATVTNGLEGIPLSNVGHFYFYDPWFIDDNSDPKGIRNRGADALPVQMNFQTDPNITTDSEHKGVFLDQGFEEGEWFEPYYKVKAPAQQTISYNGKYYPLTFVNWSAGDATLQSSISGETGVVFHSDNAVVKANYKGSLLSSTENALSGTGQRKMVKAGSSHHLIYGSMNMVWYEKIDGSGSMNFVRGEDSNILSLSIYDAKHPAIDYSGSNTIVVFQEQYTPSQPENSLIVVSYFTNGTYQNSLELLFNGEAYSSDMRPVVAISGDKAMVAWRMTSGDAGLYYQMFGIGSNLSAIGGPVKVNNTSTTSRNLAIAGDKGTNGVFYLVWQVSGKDIKHVRITSTGQGTITTPSDGTGYTNNYNPTVTVINGSPKVAFVGERYEDIGWDWVKEPEDDKVKKWVPPGGGGDGEWVKRVITRRIDINTGTWQRCTVPWAIT